ncbi:MAG: hypothetical protein KDA75_16680, partial [Planctomycetaceae bacterium]|nr:hypothetical protein [Planctomycetaceae bacterium]
NGRSWADMQRVLDKEGRDPVDAAQCVHPYVGTVYDPTAPPEPAVVGDRLEVNRLGYGHPTDPVQKRGNDRFIIAVTGGSVAYYFAYFGGPQLIERLRELPEVGDRDCRIVCLAFPGHKQPQQLMSLAYIRTLGGEFDLLVNLDGFNEVALADWNQRRKVSPAFPRNWPAVLPHGFSQKYLADHTRMWEVRAERQRNARGIRQSWLRGSALRQLWWKAHDEVLRSEEVVLNETASQSNQEESYSYRRSGPLEDYPNDEVRYQRYVEIWANASVQIEEMANGAGFAYFQFLQPNQYDPGSKPLTDDELRMAFDPGHEYRESVVKGYPILRAAGDRLRERGIRFHDLSHLFETSDETLYGDVCCHLNLRGNELLAERIADVIVRELRP